MERVFIIKNVNNAKKVYFKKRVREADAGHRLLYALALSHVIESQRSAADRQ
jgi:hypothetical protein